MAEGILQMPESDGGPSATDGFAIRRLSGPKAKSGSARDTVYIINVQPQVIIDVVGRFVEFLIDICATFSVLTQRIGNLSNHKE